MPTGYGTALWWYSGHEALSPGTRPNLNVFPSLSGWSIVSFGWFVLIIVPSLPYLPPVRSGSLALAFSRNNLVRMPLPTTYLCMYQILIVHQTATKLASVFRVDISGLTSRNTDPLSLSDALNTPTVDQLCGQRRNSSPSLSTFPSPTEVSGRRPCEGKPRLAGM